MRGLVRGLLVLLVFGLGAQLLMACGANQRQKALATALAGVDGARDGFVTWDEAHQQELALTAPSYETGQAKLGAYREAREAVVEAFELTYQALATAALSKEEATFEVAMGRIEHLYTTMRALMGQQAPPEKPNAPD